MPTVDFRSVYATVLNRIGKDAGLTDDALGRDEGGQPFEDLGVFGAPAPESSPAPSAPPVPVAPPDLQPYLEGQLT